MNKDSYCKPCQKKRKVTCVQCGKPLIEVGDSVRTQYRYLGDYIFKVTCITPNALSQTGYLIDAEFVDGATSGLAAFKMAVKLDSSWFIKV